MRGGDQKIFLSTLEAIKFQVQQHNNVRHLFRRSLVQVTYVCFCPLMIGVIHTVLTLFKKKLVGPIYIYIYIYIYIFATIFSFSET
jgi:hypothetical protein